MYIFINYKQNVKPDHELAIKIEKLLKNKGYRVFRDESRLRGEMSGLKKYSIIYKNQML